MILPRASRAEGPIHLRRPHRDRPDPEPAREHAVAGPVERAAPVDRHDLRHGLAAVGAGLLARRAPQRAAVAEAHVAAGEEGRVRRRREADGAWIKRRVASP